MTKWQEASQTIDHMVYFFFEFMVYAAILFVLILFWADSLPGAELLSVAAVQLFSVSAVVPVQDTVRHPAEPGSGEVPRRCGTQHTIDYHQDGNCFAADKLTQADHSIQYSIEQNFKSKMGSWGWQDEGWITSKAWY